ncbi:MAG: molybdopterin-dependent oxidoreductase [Rhodospirillaceae bacterium]|nr:molybdopterin-dependent oxidoreductase [Rhodospirillaceae bacterium]
MNIAATATTLTVNGEETALRSPPATRLADALRSELGLTGTKVGCDAGDCGACTVLLDGEQVCSCMVAVAQAAGRDVTTVEGLARDGALSDLQAAFLRHGAAQCGICTPGMLMAARDLLDRNPAPSEQEAADALGGVLCRCTGYRKIVEAVLDAAGSRDFEAPDTESKVGAAVGARIARLDGAQKLTGDEVFGADFAPPDALTLRVLRSPIARGRFEIGDLDSFRQARLGIAAVLTATDIPGSNVFGVYPVGKDQPVLADRIVRYRGEAVLAVVGNAGAVAALRDEDLPVVWHEEAPVTGIDAASAADAPLVQGHRDSNVLARGRVVKGDIERGFAEADFVAEGTWRTSFVEHAYIEPEAGWARRIGDRLEIHVSTQSPYMDRDETALILGIDEEQVRIVPTACGGGFGGKLDISVQPLIALAAWTLGVPVRCTYTRPESMASSTKRHPAAIRARAGCMADGRLTAFEFHGDFDTGAYASWGPTVADRVPVHAAGPYVIPHVKNTSCAWLTNAPPSGAFRGFGVPQSAIANEALLDDLAGQCGLDPLAFRLKNAIRKGDETSSGQVLEHSAGLAACFEALQPDWDRERAEADRINRAGGPLRRGVGVAGMWYGCGNTSMSNPSTMKLGISAGGQVTLYNGAMDMGQGPNTIMPQIAADALGVPVGRIANVAGDTDRTADAGKSSASRQTFVSGRATQIAGETLRANILRLANVGPAAALDIGDGRIVLRDGDAERTLDLRAMAPDAEGDVLAADGTFDPPTKPLDANGQGVPYATYGFGAHLAVVDIDVELGTIKVRRIVAAHDVGRAINPTLLEGQIHGGVAQGLGLALMEEFVPGRTENLHDYLIPTFGDVPPIDTILIEDPEPLGPYGAKGIGEQALIPTAPAIFNAVHHATGVRLRHAPALPHRVRDALLAAQEAGHA